MANPLTLLKTVYGNKLGLPALPQPGTFEGKHVLITGASSGLGLATAIHYVNLGACSVIITARTQSKGQAAKSRIETATNTSGKGVVKVMELDMSTLSGTKAFADRVKTEVKELDIVLLNAGLINTSFKLGEAGWEQSLQVHVLSTALLALELLQWLKSLPGKDKHLNFTTSGLHRSIKIGKQDGWPQEHVLDFFNKKENWPKKPDMYAISKLLEQYVVNEIAKPEVITNSVCPGFVKTDLARDYKTNVLMSVAVEGFMTVISKSTEGGARSLVLVATKTPRDNGKHWADYQTDEEYHKSVQHNILCSEGQEMQAQVWKEVLDILEKDVPDVKKIAGAA